jgi:hypothetical protein
MVEVRGLSRNAKYLGSHDVTLSRAHYVFPKYNIMRIESYGIRLAETRLCVCPSNFLENSTEHDTGTR